MNVIENLLNMLYLYLAHVTGSPVAPLIGFTSATMTLSKTVLYWLQDYFCGWCSLGHNSWQDFLLLFVLSNGCVGLSSGCSSQLNIFYLARG